MNLESQAQIALIDVARASITGPEGGAPASEPDFDTFPAPLAAPGASFVTLTVRDELRGCCGTITACCALVKDVWLNARRSAFDDPRFSPLTRNEHAHSHVEVAVLGALERLEAESEAALLATLRPGLDGLLLSFGDRRATFLPKVWEKLPEPEDFLRQLKRKMGAPADFWDSDLQVHRYTTQTFGAKLSRES